jgi:hypothetical protein
VAASVFVRFSTMFGLTGWDTLGMLQVMLARDGQVDRGYGGPIL